MGVSFVLATRHATGKPFGGRNSVPSSSRIPRIVYTMVHEKNKTCSTLFGVLLCRVRKRQLAKHQNVGERREVAGSRDRRTRRQVPGPITSDSRYNSYRYMFSCLLLYVAFPKTPQVLDRMESSMMAKNTYIYVRIMWYMVPHPKDVAYARGIYHY